jgi:hypothetical protein
MEEWRVGGMDEWSVGCAFGIQNRMQPGLRRMGGTA